MNVFIRQLTGIRFVAAAWVLLYHLQGPLNQLHLLIPVFSDVLRVGRLGVDLFFALSGFILTHTYLRRLGPAVRVRGTVDFWWLRLARIYPVHIVMLFIAGGAVVAQAKVTGETLDRDWLNPLDFAKNLLLVQEWGPEPQRGWNFVAWSLSMEWLAYLVFPLLVLLLWVPAPHGSRPRCSCWPGWWRMTPLVVYGLSTSDPYYTDNWGSTYRILTEFTTGAITYLIVCRFLPGDRLSEPASPRVERTASVLAVVLPLLVVVGAVFLSQWAAAQPPSVGPRRRRRAAAAVLPPAARAAADLLDRRAGPVAPRTRTLPVHPRAGARRLHLVLAVHDAPGVVRALARGDAGRRASTAARSTRWPWSSSSPARSSWRG